MEAYSIEILGMRIRLFREGYSLSGVAIDSEGKAVAVMDEHGVRPVASAGMRYHPVICQRAMFLAGMHTLKQGDHIKVTRQLRQGEGPVIESFGATVLEAGHSEGSVTIKYIMDSPLAFGAGVHELTVTNEQLAPGDVEYIPGFVLQEEGLGCDESSHTVQ